MSLLIHNPYVPPRGHVPASTPFNEAQVVKHDGMVQVFVGREPYEVMFEASERVLRHHSGYFNDLLNGMDFIDDHRDALRLPGDQPQIFGMVHSFMHRRLWFDFPQGSEAHLHMSFDTMIELWTFAERRRMPLVQNAVSDLFVKRVREVEELPDRFAVEFLWERTTPTSLLRKLLIDIVRPMWLPDRKMYYNKIWNQLTPSAEDPERLIANMYDLTHTSPHSIRISDKTLKRMLGCEWHVHEDHVACEGSEEARLPDLQGDWQDVWWRNKRKDGYLMLKGVRWTPAEVLAFDKGAT